MSVTTIRKANNGVYYVHWTEGRRSKRASLGTKDPDEAERRRAKRTLIADEVVKVETGLTGEYLPISDLWSSYEKRHVSKENASPSGAVFTWKNLSVGFGRLRAVEITQEIIDDYEAKRAAGKIGRKSKAPTVRRELAILRACLNWCASPKRKLLDPTLIPHFDLPSAGEPRDRWLKQDELHRLLTAAASFRSDGRLSRIEIFLWLAIETGARKAALLDLTWDRVDLETRVIHLNVPGRKQTKKRRSDVPISKSLLPILTRARDERENDLVLGNKGEVWGGVQKVAGLAGFGSSETRVVVREDGTKKYLRRRATGVSPHVLRHTAATNMARRGVPLWIVAKVLGNSLEMVEKVYAKHAPDDLRAAVDAISSNFSASNVHNVG